MPEMVSEKSLADATNECLKLRRAVGSGRELPE
jgi:hypothetical protein